MKSIETGEIRGLSQKLQGATEDWQRKPIVAKLDSIANDWMSSELRMIGENALERDEAIDLLRPFGALTVAEMFAASREWPPLPPEEPSLTKGMALFGLAREDIDRLSIAFNK